MNFGQRLRRIAYITGGIVLTIVILSSRVSGAATYYITTNGNDANPGSESAPFRTLKKGVTILRPGDTLYVKSGTYMEALINAIPSGTSWSAPVTVAAYPGHTVTLRPSSGERVLQIEGRHHIVIDGFVIDAVNVNNNAIKITKGNSGTGGFIRIKNSEIKNTCKSGIYVGTEADGNHFVNLNVHEVGTNHPGSECGYAFYINSSNNIIENSHLHDNGRWAVHIYNGYTGKANNNIIRNNQIYRNALKGIGGGAVIIGVGDSNMLYNNIIWNNRENGIWTKGSNSKIYNNTVYGNGKDGIYASNGSGHVIRNNIVYQNGVNIKNVTGAMVSHNLITSPNFVDPLANDFRLQVGSPAIDRGVMLSEVKTDFASVSRPKGTAYDIGAYEYTDGTGPARITAPSNLRVMELN
jgi:parallel beta-helix repeat protein